MTELKKVEKVEPVASTSTSQMEIPMKVVLDTLEQDTMHPSWYNALQDEFSKPYFAQVGLHHISIIGTQCSYPSTAEEVLGNGTSFQHRLPYLCVLVSLTDPLPLPLLYLHSFISQ